MSVNTNPDPNEYGIVYDISHESRLEIEYIKKSIIDEFSVIVSPDYDTSHPHVSLIQSSIKNVETVKEIINSCNIPKRIEFNVYKIKYLPTMRYVFLMTQAQNLQEIHNKVLEICKSTGCKPIRQIVDRVNSGEYTNEALRNFSGSYGPNFTESAHLTLFKISESQNFNQNDLDNLFDRLKKEIPTKLLGTGPRLVNINYFGSLL